MRSYRFGQLEFAWDDRKASANARKHRVGFEEGVTVFADPSARLYADPDHSSVEERFLLVGHSFSDRLLLVVHAERDDVIRIISARRATPGEREDYENDAQ
jgi:uncharacterized protein